jgi:hypothetical protein
MKKLGSERLSNLLRIKRNPMFIEYNGIFFKATFRNKGLVPVFVDLLNFPDFHIVSHKLVCVSEDQLNNSLF